MRPMCCGWPISTTFARLRSFVYLATLLDAYSRKCVGWNLSKRIDTQLALGALEKALTTRDVRPGLIHHSDRGVKSASTAYVERLLSPRIAQRDIACSKRV